MKRQAARIKYLEVSLANEEKLHAEQITRIWDLEERIRLLEAENADLKRKVEYLTK